MKSSPRSPRKSPAHFQAPLRDGPPARARRSKRTKYRGAAAPGAPSACAGIATAQEALARFAAMGDSERKFLLGYLPAWIKKYWGSKPEHSPKYKPGTGLIRRPDVVIVKDASKPPTQNNIKQIVEMKFPPDTLTARQRDAYILIAGEENKLATLEPGDCDCQSEEPKGPNMPVEELGAAAAAAAWVAYILSKRKTPRPPLRPVPGLAPIF